MERDELLHKISTFPLAASDLARDMLSGDFRSVFRGEGIEFDEVRRYEIGDDIRAIDRNVSARYGKPYIKLYREERELTVFVVLDFSASMFVRTESPVAISRIDQSILAAALVAFSAEKAGQRFGALFFDNEIRKIFKPKRGRNHVMAFVREALSFRPGGRGTKLGGALSAVPNLLRRRGIVVIVSDFLSTGWEDSLGRIAEKHDCVACRISDPEDTDFPPLGLVVIEDPETGARVMANTSDASFRRSWSEHHTERTVNAASVFRRYGVPNIELSTTGDALFVLKNFFRSRKN